MKGLALILKPKGGSKSPMGPEEDSDDEAPDSEGGDSSAKEYAKLAAEAIADGDTDAAADALVSLVKACKGY